MLRAIVIRGRCYELTVKYRYYVLVQADCCMHDGNLCRPDWKVVVVMACW